MKIENFIPTGDKEKDKESHDKTAGEKAFDRTVYTGIGFGVNEVSSLFIADEIEHGKGKPFFEKTAKWIEKNLGHTLKEEMKNGKLITTAEKSKNMVMTASLLVGGTLLVVPMKWLEDHKSFWVKKANHAIDKLKGNNDEAAIAQRDAEVQRVINNQSKQSWMSLLVGRVSAVAATVFVGSYILGPQKNAKIKEFTDKKIVSPATIGLDKITGNQPNSSIKRMMQSDRYKRLSGLTGVEAIYCLISSVSLEAASKFYSALVEGRRGKKKNGSPITDEPQAPEMLPSVASSAHTDDNNESDKKSHALTQILDNKSETKDFVTSVASRNNEPTQLGV